MVHRLRSGIMMHDLLLINWNCSRVYFVVHMSRLQMTIVLYNMSWSFRSTCTYTVAQFIRTHTQPHTHTRTYRRHYLSCTASPQPQRQQNHQQDDATDGRVRVWTHVHAVQPGDDSAWCLRFGRVCSDRSSDSGILAFKVCTKHTHTPTYGRTHRNPKPPPQAH